jgi:hypothetical protein
MLPLIQDGLTVYQVCQMDGTVLAEFPTYNQALADLLARLNSGVQVYLDYENRYS